MVGHYKVTCIGLICFLCGNIWRVTPRTIAKIYYCTCQTVYPRQPCWLLEVTNLQLSLETFVTYTGHAFCPQDGQDTLTCLLHLLWLVYHTCYPPGPITSSAMMVIPCHPPPNMWYIVSTVQSNEWPQTMLCHHTHKIAGLLHIHKRSFSLAVASTKIINLPKQAIARVSSVF